MSVESVLALFFVLAVIQDEQGRGQFMSEVSPQGREDSNGRISWGACQSCVDIADHRWGVLLVEEASFRQTQG